jgi:hypothetical protein
MYRGYVESDFEVQNGRLWQAMWTVGSYYDRRLFRIIFLHLFFSQILDARRILGQDEILFSL